MPPKKKEEEKPKTVMLGRPGSNLKIGIVGVPNVGKSSFFNILTKQNVPAENFPFCTIDPNMAKVAVPDSRYDLLCQIFKPASEVPAMLQVTDIAGLVKGASEGAGLGNAFLSHIQAVDGIFHMCRIFESEDITHVEGDVDPVRDLDIIFQELVAKDLDNVVKTIEKLRPIVDRGLDKTKKVDLEYLMKIKEVLEGGAQIRCVQCNGKEAEYLNTLQLLTAKPAVFLLNMSEQDFLRKKSKWLPRIKEWVDKTTGEPIIPFSVEFEAKVQGMTAEEVTAYVAQTGGKCMLPKIITEGYHALHLIHFFTAGEDEVRCWTIQANTKAPQAAGKIHTDMENGFICAEVTHWKDFEDTKDLVVCKDTGRLRQEGKTYEMLDGDIVVFKFNPPSSSKKK